MSEGFGRYNVYATAGSIYCYPDSNTLKNRFGIRGPVQLKKIESDIALSSDFDTIYDAPSEGAQFR